MDNADPVCRICFDGAEAESLIKACGCSGTHAHVHESCLLRWRRLQQLQGKLSAAMRCEVCGQKYSTSLAAPERPLRESFYEYVSVVGETAVCLFACAVTTPFAFCSPLTLVLVGMPCLIFGILKGILAILVSFPVAVCFLYMNHLKLSVFGSPGQYQIGLSSFGAPVDGLQKGMLLVSIGARGPFEHTILYVIEHSDSSTLAVVLNKPLRSRQVSVDNGGKVNVSIRSGGPLRGGSFCMHDVDGVAGAERLLQGHQLYLSSGRGISGSMDAATAAAKGGTPKSILVLQGYASWGGHQLEGEVRRGAWGWIKPEHVQPADLLQMDSTELEGCWSRLVNSPNLQIFEG
eukprot:TRINITY_DN47649_c0_g1_i1.p1 TRINITY_DN47649_c0_g1~~TRINITY_DN47649_c0_g1_i1.p1  ORF type:complete len:347 (-),score=37.97 TRINITY_DN47649_c0_g1_i1:126-1166(-)